MSRQKIHARSGRVAGAVRGRSLWPWPAATRALGTSPFLRPLTPARWHARRLVSQLSASAGCGGRFQGGTALEPCWNSQLIELAALFARFQRFQLGGLASCARVHTCAHMRTCEGQNLGTLEPSLFFYSYQDVRGSKVVPQRFRLGTARSAPWALLADGHILAGGNAGALAAIVVQGASSDVDRSRAAQTFGVFGLLEAAWSVAGCGRSEPAGHAVRNGGILPFLSAASGRVGRVMLDAGAQGVGIACLFGARRKPGRLRRAALVELAGRGAQGTPPCPLSRIRTSPAPSRGRLAEFGTAFGNSLIQAVTGGSDRAQILSRPTGRGEGFASGQSAERGTGRGMGAAGSLGEAVALRRTAEASGEARHVNAA